jgi:hypothetical protein
MPRVDRERISDGGIAETSPEKQRRFVMRRTLVAMAAAAALAVGTFAVPQKAEAFAWWWIPTAIVGGVALGAAVGAPYAYAAPRGQYIGSDCRIMRERVPGGWRRVEVCY